MNRMTDFEQQAWDTARYYDREIRKIEATGVEILSSVVPGSGLHRVINNPVTEGIDEG